MDQHMMMMVQLLSSALSVDKGAISSTLVNYTMYIMWDSVVAAEKI